jgi:DNA-binding MarR family transcriptional regulator
MSRGRSAGAVGRITDEIRAFDASLDLLDAAVATAFGISRTDLRAMEFVSRQEGATAGQLATALDLTTGSVTVLIDRMERAGYFRRRDDPTDRRKVLVELTAKGKERERRTFGPLARESARILSGYSERDLAVIGDFLRKARELAERSRARIDRAPPR